MVIYLDPLPMPRGEDYDIEEESETKDSISVSETPCTKNPVSVDYPDGE